MCVPPKIGSLEDLLRIPRQVSYAAAGISMAASRAVVSNDTHF